MCVHVLVGAACGRECVHVCVCGWEIGLAFGGMETKPGCFCEHFISDTPNINTNRKVFYACLNDGYNYGSFSASILAQGYFCSVQDMIFIELD